MKYNVTAKRWARGWELHVEGVGVTQCHRLPQARAMAADYVLAKTERPTAPEDINLAVQLGGDEDAAVAGVRNATRAAAEAQRTAARQARSLARHLSGEGLAATEIAVILNVTPQRVGQLLKDEAA